MITIIEEIDGSNANIESEEFHLLIAEIKEITKTGEVKIVFS